MVVLNMSDTRTIEQIARLLLVAATRIKIPTYLYQELVVCASEAPSKSP